MARRGRGEGSIYRRDDGTWVAVIHLGWHDGKRRRKYLYARTRAEVRDKYRKAQRALEEGRSLGDDRQKVGQYLEWWLSQALPGTVRDTTVVSYRGALRANVIPHIGHIRLSKLTPQHVQAMLTAIQDKGLSARTAKYAHAVLRRALGQAERWGMVTRNVATLVEPPRAVRPEVRSLKPDEVHTLLDAARGDRFEAILTVAIAVGLRRGEALGLRWSDIDLEAAVLRVRRALVYVDGDLRFVDPKTKRSRRTIPLPSVSIQALREHRRRQAAERLAAGPAWEDDDLVFPSATGGPMDPNNLGRHFRALCDRAGIGRVRLHDLRHTCASLLLAQNVHPRVVMEILGHSGIAITMDTYSHVLPELQREAADRMDQALGYTDTDDEEQDPPEPDLGIDGA